ncbi:MAG TPA: DNA cytosine methyltransferase [Verrucomicrobiae bacterium]|jgi:DNA (cytosine-5)-methyltransferase 1
MTPVVNTYFSGCGLVDIGLEQSGVQLGQSFEIDSVCCETARANFSHPIVQCDLQHKLAFDQSDCDVMVFTYPCNRYAEIAAVHGKRVGDVLYLHAFRHIALKRPEIFWLENVPGMRKFPVVMEAMSRLPDYYVTVFCPVSSQIWLPQRRDRLILVGSRRPFQWNKPTSRSRIALKDILEENPEVEIPRYVKKRINGKYRDLPIISDPARGDIAPTCVAHYSKDVSTRLVVDRRAKLGVRPYSVREYARLQGVPDSFLFPCSPRAAYKMIGNGVSIPVGRWMGRESRRYFKMN